MSSKGYTFDIFQCMVLQMHFCDVIGPKCYLIKCLSQTEQMYTEGF